MRRCNNLKSVSLNISKLKHLERVDFSHCGALTEAILSDTPSVVDMEANHILSTWECYLPNVILDFTNCFNLDQEALIEQQTVFKSLVLLCEESPSYFTHHATGTSLTLPLLQTSLSQPFFKLRDRLGCSFDSFGKKHAFWSFWNSQKDCYLVILDCSFPLNEDNDNPAELNYDHVDVQLHMSSDYPTSYLKGWGIRLFDYCEECGGSVVETERNRLRRKHQP
ncbi:Protein VARIATION IN COMPOUND TRIGGERED ROOT growth response [Cardamine amara subsp. amara]|uniref:Protein VARIATION IN COMPOUND TRIGGERED ROOT growth response n=1 Tax=Cardamine amara subsp. amara TaxID=228776 RepID=A0ABD1ALH9_CARAN